MKASPMKWNPFKLRNIAGVALALGILVGIWLGDLFKGFGLGPGQGPGQGTGTGRVANISATKGTSDTGNEAADLVGHHKGETDESNERTTPHDAQGLIKVLIDDRSYFLLRGDKKQPISVEALVEQIERAAPNEDGLRAVVERTAASRVSAEMKLFDALKAAGVPTNSVYLAPHAVD